MNVYIYLFIYLFWVYLYNVPSLRFWGVSLCNESLPCLI